MSVGDVTISSTLLLVDGCDVNGFLANFDDFLVLSFGEEAAATVAAVGGETWPVHVNDIRMSP